MLGDVHDVHRLKADYHRFIHPWMPIISRRTSGKLGQPKTAAAALLLLCMKLALEMPGLHARQSALYNMAKQFAFNLDVAGVFSVAKLQAKLLIVVYELGHARLPAAYLTIADCARQAIAMGLHDSNAPQLLQRPRNWVDWEERRRVWSLVIILDRSSLSPK
jgi:Fungal specific transcription factor domain